MDKKYQVFISSTYTDMIDERQAAVTAILEAGHIPAGMELFSASNNKQMDVIKRWIDACDVFMLILGGRYGSIDPDSGKSYIQLEYEYAIQTKKPFFALCLTDQTIRDKAKGPLGLDAVEMNDSRKLADFRATVLGKMCSLISDVKDIRIQAGNSIRDLAKTNNLDGWVRASRIRSAPSGHTERAPLIEMVTGASERYHSNEIQSGHMLSTVRVGIRNAGGKTLSNCKVYVEQISPPPDIPSADSKLLDTGAFQLRHDDPERLVDIAAHWDHLDKFRFCAPLPGGMFGDPFDLNDKGRRTFAVRVRATECERSAMFELATDDSKRLSLTFLRYLD
ncbi:DUF4062 domain-containing protein [Paraburkholderia phymatum]|uniref:DUF4062 domain-containing protein n=1 Tax=Paraburkholderia phymatum (strain DSM 17167 / CIP 108236 / LMG 21445 / STM815) TaxID=391038 RepID=B2JTB2_PARP8|nr:DUF4062 domain-containing protein [Paraburkholderia phymatum]ACC75815.1 hypothetical protein Bphy_6797 [Paraburkholderia phymatum STM815]